MAQKESIAVKFILNDGSQFECGSASDGYSSIVPQGSATDEIAVIGLSGALNDNQPQGGDIHREKNHLVKMGASYVNLIDFGEAQKTSFLAASGGSALETISYDTIVDAAWPTQIFDIELDTNVERQPSSSYIDYSSRELSFPYFDAYTIPKLSEIDLYTDPNNKNLCTGFQTTYDVNGALTPAVHTVSGLNLATQTIETITLGGGVYISDIAVSIDTAGAGEALGAAVKFTLSNGNEHACGNFDETTNSST